MKPYLFSIFIVSAGIGCVTTSSEEQRKAEIHQSKSDDAAANGQFGVAGQEQRQAAESHHAAVMKAIDEGKPIPRQTQQGDHPPDGGS